MSDMIEFEKKRDSEKINENERAEEKTERDKFVHMIEQTEPDEETKERIWNLLDESTETHRSFPMVKVASVAVVAILLFAGGTFSVNAATGGRFFDSIAEASNMDGSLFEKIRYVCGDREHQKQVAQETVKIPIEVYAPAILACSDRHIIFANERGLMVYDQTAEKIAAALDLQEMGCNYLNADTVETCIFMEDDRLYIFNAEKAGKNERDTSAEKRIANMAYIYRLSLAGDEAALEMTQDKSELDLIFGKWKSYKEQHVRDTFDEMQVNVIDLNELAGHGDASYSENCIAWTGDDGEDRESFLVVTADNKYMLYTRDMADDSLTKQELTVVTESAVSDKGQSAQGLPAFEYSGDDEIMRALIKEGMREQDSYLRTDGSVFIVAPIIYETVNEGDDVIVFCDMSVGSYYQNGNTLNCESGGVEPSRIRLTLDENGGYEVAEHLVAEDGALYVESIEAFCKEYNVSPDIFMGGSNGAQTLEEILTMYVKDNHLPIKYYKDYGWDPVPLDVD